MERMDFICFGGEDWWYHNRGHTDMQLTRRFAKMGRALYVNSIVMEKPNFKKGGNFTRKLVRKTKSILTGHKKTSDGFWVYSPFTMPVHHISWAKEANAALLRFQVEYVISKLSIHKPLVLVAIPAACDVALKMRRQKLIYQRTDRFEEAAAIDVETIKRYDRKLKACADLTIYVNKALYQQESQQCKRALFLDQGVDYELFVSAEADEKVPPDIADIPKPIIGYFGEIFSNSVDIALTEKIADLLPDVSFVYIGGRDMDVCANLAAKKNVWMPGRKDYLEIPYYGKCFDVAILPWRQNRWTAAANPIKVKEYLALGKPLVSTPACAQLQGYSDVMYVGETAEEFAGCIVRALQEDNNDHVTARKTKVRKDTWDSKARLLLTEVFKKEHITREAVLSGRP